MALPTTTKVWIVNIKPTGHTVLSGPDATFVLEERPIPELKDGQLLIEAYLFSNDPAQRAWVDGNVAAERLYTDPVEKGDAMRAIAIHKVIASKDPNYKVGSLVRGFFTWTQYSVVNASEVQPVREIPGVSTSQFLGALGGTGLTAYVGLYKIGRAKAGETVVISGAAGATGSMAVQIAKHVIGCKKVIGLAGSDEKCRWVESLGADVCINYKKDWVTELKKATDGYVDVYFDNVAGETLDFMITRMKQGGRIVACGGVSDYNKGEKTGIKNWMEIVMQRLEVKGFIVTDHQAEFPKMIGELVEASKAGKIKIDDSNETVIDTKFEEIPNTWVKLFSGGNQGKLVSKIV